MAFIDKRLNVPSEEDEKFRQKLAEVLFKYSMKLSDIINGDIRIDENLNAETLTISDSGGANTENTVAHTLKRIPVGFMVVNIDKAGIVYDSGTSWTASNLYVKCNVANAAIKLLVY